MFRTWVACGRNPRTAEALRPLRLFEQREGPHCSKYIAFCPSFQDAFPRFRERSARSPDRASHHAAVLNRMRPHRPVPLSPQLGAAFATSSPQLGAAFATSSPQLRAAFASPHRPRRPILRQPANRSGRACSRCEASRACAPKRFQCGMIRPKYKEMRPPTRPPPHSIRPLSPIARNEQVGFCRHFGRE